MIVDPPKPGRRIGTVVAVSRSPEHGFSKVPQERVNLLEGRGVEGDCHAGAKTQHLYRMERWPDQPNLCQVHFLHAELFDEMAVEGYPLKPGDMGENVLTRGLDLLAMPTGALFAIGEALVEISGIRDPCKKIDTIGKGLTKKLFDRGPQGEVIRKAGIMGVVRRGGIVSPGDTIEVTLPAEPHRPLEVV